MALEFGSLVIPFSNSACPSDPVSVVTAVTRGANKGQRVPRTVHGKARTSKEWTSGFVIHTTSGTVFERKPGLVQSMRDWVYAKTQTNSDRSVSWHNSIDTDASLVQSANSRWTCWHAMQVNPFTDSCELVQDNKSLTDAQLQYFVQFMDTWTFHTGIPRIIPWRNGRPYAGMLTRALSAYGAGRTLCCIYGHRNVWGLDKAGKLTPYRGAGDPSDLPFLALEEAGYLRMDVEQGEDLAYWKSRQREAGLAQDGVAGPDTRRALLNSGRVLGGMIVSRPGDIDQGVPAWTVGFTP